MGIVLLFLLQSAKPEPPQNMPAETGVYYRQGGAVWTRLNPAVVADMKAEGVGLFIDTGGYSNLETRGTLQGAKASIRIPDPKPTLHVRGVGRMSDVILLRLKQDRDTRTFDTSSVDATIENKGGFRKADICRTEIVVYADASFAITPEQNLKSGEYLLAFGYANVSFDFGIDPQRKQ